MIKNWSTFKREKENLFEMIMLLSSIIFLALSPIDLYTATKIGSVAVLLVWMKLTALIARFPSFGIYIYMAVFVFTTIIMFLTLYLTTLIGFALSFHMLLGNQRPFANPVSSLLKVLVMMIGEFDYDDNFASDYSKTGSFFRLSHNDVAQITFVFFIMFVSIILANLIVGLTVNKTDELFRKADNYYNSKKVLNISMIEKLLLVTGVSKWIPQKFSREGIQLLDMLEEKISRKINRSQNFLNPKSNRVEWQVCVYANEERHRVIPWYKNITHSQSSEEEVSNYKVYICNKRALNYGKDTKANMSQWMYSTRCTIPYEIVKETLERILKLRETKFLHR